MNTNHVPRTVLVGLATIEARSTACIDVSSCNDAVFRGHRFVMRQGQACIVQCIFIGNTPQLSKPFRCDDLPADRVPNAIRENGLLDACEPEVRTVLYVENPTGEAVVFEMEIVGEAMAVVPKLTGPARMAFMAAIRRRIAARAKPSTTQLVPASIEKRKWCMGFGPVTIPARGRVPLSVQPKVTFESSVLICTGDDGLLVRGKGFGDGESPVSFVDKRIPVEITTHPALYLEIEVENPTDEERVFAASMVGMLVRGRQ